ncbi:unnamed protein product, partial [Closterium sp. NIES-54]
PPPLHLDPSSVLSVPAVLPVPTVLPMLPMHALFLPLPLSWMPLSLMPLCPISPIPPQVVRLRSQLTLPLQVHPLPPTPFSNPPVPVILLLLLLPVLAVPPGHLTSTTRLALAGSILQEALVVLKLQGMQRCLEEKGGQASSCLLHPQLRASKRRSIAFGMEEQQSFSPTHSPLTLPQSPH